MSATQINEITEAPRNRLKLRGIEFGPVIGASGIQGFFGEGYPYHRIYRRLFGKRFRFDGMGFVAKTVTLNCREGNMPLKGDGLTPKERKPKCIVVNFRKGYALNAVGLSNFGARFYLDSGRWQARRDNFMISFMSVEKEADDRIRETESFVSLLERYDLGFQGLFGIQDNESCPNVGTGHGHAIEEIWEKLDKLARIRRPKVIKINLLTSPLTAAKIASHPECDAICVSNTLPWGSLPDRVNWKKLFGTEESPLKALGGGGLSGAPLLPLLAEWLLEARGIVKKPIIAGGGILRPNDIHCLLKGYPSSLSLGTIAMLRPWNLASTIEHARFLL